MIRSYLALCCYKTRNPDRMDLFQP